MAGRKRPAESFGIGSARNAGKGSRQSKRWSARWGKSMADKSPTANKQLFADYAVDQFFNNALFGRADTDERLMELGISRRDLQKLESDDEISGAIETRREAVIATPWHIGFATQQNDDDRLTFVWDQLAPVIESILRISFKSILYGYSVAECVYKWVDGGIGIASYSEKPFWWFNPDVDGSLIFMNPKGGPEIVDTKYKFFLTVREPTYYKPQGEALLTRLYSAWFFRTYGWRFWMQYLERVGIPFLVGNTDGNTEAMAAALDQMVRGGSMAVGADDKVSMLAQSGAGDAFAIFEDRVARRIQKMILGQTGTTDVSNSGSYAAAKVQAESVLDVRRQSDMRLCSLTANRVVAALWELNGFDGEIPMFVMEDSSGIQQDRAQRDATLVEKGIVRGFTKDYILKNYDLEEGDFEPVDLSATSAPAAPPQSRMSTSFAGGQRFTPQQQAIEDIINEGVARSGLPIDDALVMSAIRAAENPDDLEERLAVVLRGLMPDEFDRVVERAVFAADVMGFVHAKGGA